jgi:hypothetical protein
VTLSAGARFAARIPLQHLPRVVDSMSMAIQPSVLILDDGELGNIHRMLRRLGTDVVRLEGAEIGSSVLAPRDLLITAGRRTLQNMPELSHVEEAASPPIWVCVHSQDFLPMRQRLNEMGVHYLLQNALDEPSRERFLVQLLRKGVEQRAEFRLYLGGEIRYRTGPRLAVDGEADDDGSTSGRLVELSLEGCRILTQESVAEGAQLTALLPSELGGGDELELSGVVVRAADTEVHAGHDYYGTVIRFAGIEGEQYEHLAGIIRGERIGTKLTLLASPPEASDEASDEGKEDPELDPNRRVEVRHHYDRRARVLGFGPTDEDPVLGRDLSLSGVRLSDCSGLEAGASVTVALYGAAREEPTVLEATVVRTNQGGEVALEFDRVSSINRRSLEKLLSSQPVLDALDQPDPDAGRTVVAEVRAVGSD